MLSSLPSEVKLSLEKHLHQKVISFSYVGGGCINNTGKLTFNDGAVFFIKWNNKSRFPSMFTKEALGLNELTKQYLLRIPNIVLVEESLENYSFLLLEFIESGHASQNHWQKLGKGIAQLHQIKNDSYGLAYDNYIGSLPQINHTNASWGDFYLNSRIIPMVEQARKAGLFTNEQYEAIVSIYDSIQGLCHTKELPTLLHGDLWSGNVFADENETPVIIDPAVYYGNREVELAFTELFGGFDQAFYTSYNREYPLDNGYINRKHIYQLYPLLVHVNLFGGGYINSVMQIVKKFN